MTVGYLLSPLSFWNDLFINIPIAYAFGFLFGLLSKNLFLPFMIIGYWLTNILGFTLLHKGATEIFAEEKNKYSKKDLAKDLLISVLYTFIIIIIVKLGWLKFPAEYFK